MKLFLSIITLAGLMFSQPMLARNFYTTSFSISANYSHIRTGTTDLFDKKVKVYYSDDADFCFMQFSEAEYECQVTEFLDDDVQYPVIPVSGEIFQKLYLDALYASGKGEAIQKSMERLIVKIPESFTISKEHRFGMQLHDEVPESFHVYFYYLDRGYRY